MYPHDQFTVDVTDAAGASQCEKGAQWHAHKHKHTEDKELEQENNDTESPTKKSHTNHQTKVVEMVWEHNKADQVLFEEARQEECKQQEVLLNGLNWLGDSMSLLANTIVEDQQAWDEAEARQQAESATMLKVIKALAQKGSVP
ncbi:hypothetical protein FRC11_011850 [Ceratobasidium sp. 423]|nr:hypothetical protein FRC11_011850 [Ceratobasidium sp. 423]